MSADGGLRSADPKERAARAAALGVRGDLGRETVEQLGMLASADPDGRVRGAALGALARSAPASATAHDAWLAAAGDAEPSVRRRAAEEAPRLPYADPAVVIGLLSDPDGSVAEASAFALGEMGQRAVGAGAVDALSHAAGGHADPLVREAAVAALGSLGDAAGLPAILRGCADRPAVRRRAVLALAPFTGPEVERALERAREDRDWQVRQAAEDLLRA